MAAPKKTDDLEIIGLNSVGISLKGIGERIGFHHTTVAARLKLLGIPPADTRRSFMEDIYDELSPDQRAWLIEKLNAGTSVKDFVKHLITLSYLNRKI